MGFNIWLAGRLLDKSEYDTANDSQIVVRQNDGSEAVFSFASDIRFYGQAAQDIRSQIINATNPYISSLEVILRSDCCSNFEFVGSIDYSSVRWCERGKDRCYVEAAIKDESEISKKISCLKNTVISSRASIDGSITTQGEDTYRNALYFDFCAESRPKSFYVTFLLISIFVVQALSVPLFIAGLLIGNVRMVRNYIIEKASGCGKKLKAPFVHSYLNNICQLCGLGLQSTLFSPGGFLHNLVRADINFRNEASTVLEANDEYQNFNKPSLTATQFLDSLKEFNIGYRINGQFLQVERKDQLQSSVFADYTGVRESDIISLCFNYDDEKPFAGRFYRYPTDHSDKVSNQLTDEYSYLANYNIPFNPILRGVDQRTFQYHFFVYGSDFRVDSALKTIANLIPFSNTLFGLNQDNIIMQTETRSFPVLGIWDGSSATTSARCQRISTSQGFLYNHQLTARPAAYDTLYNKLLYIDDNRISGLRSIINFTLVASFNCQDLANLGNAQTVKFLRNGNVVTGEIQEIQVDLNRNELTIIGKC
jgi:hypothetical protein